MLAHLHGVLMDGAEVLVGGEVEAYSSSVAVVLVVDVYVVVVVGIVGVASVVVVVGIVGVASVVVVVGGAVVGDSVKNFSDSRVNHHSLQGRLCLLHVLFLGLCVCVFFFLCFCAPEK